MHGFMHGLDLTLFIIISFLPLILLIYIYNDAEDKYSNGCMWAIIIIFTSWIGIILYFIMRYFFERSTTAKTLGDQFPIDTSHMGRFGHGIAGQSGPETGKQTVFGKENPDAHEFRDYHAEELIEEARYEDAEVYLREMAEIAKRDGDAKRVTTYRYYYNKIQELKLEKKN
jgi:hypothetical protein